MRQIDLNKLYYGESAKIYDPEIKDIIMEAYEDGDDKTIKVLTFYVFQHLNEIIKKESIDFFILCMEIYNIPLRYIYDLEGGITDKNKDFFISICCCSGRMIENSQTDDACKILTEIVKDKYIHLDINNCIQIILFCNFKRDYERMGLNDFDLLLESLSLYRLNTDLSNKEFGLILYSYGLENYYMNIFARKKMNKDRDFYNRIIFLYSDFRYIAFSILCQINTANIKKYIDEITSLERLNYLEKIFSNPNYIGENISMLYSKTTEKRRSEFMDESDSLIWDSKLNSDLIKIVKNSFSNDDENTYGTYFTEILKLIEERIAVMKNA